MTLGVIGKKLGMTQIFDEQGLAIPVTVIKVDPIVVTGSGGRHCNAGRSSGFAPDV